MIAYSRLQQVTNDTEKHVDDGDDGGDGGKKVADLPRSGIKYHTLSEEDQEAVEMLMGSETDQTQENWDAVARDYIATLSTLCGPCQGGQLEIPTSCGDLPSGRPTDAIDHFTGQRTPLPGTSFHHHGGHGVHRLCRICTDELARRAAAAAAQALTDNDPMEICDPAAAAPDATQPQAPAKQPRQIRRAKARKARKANARQARKARKALQAQLDAKMASVDAANAHADAVAAHAHALHTHAHSQFAQLDADIRAAVAQGYPTGQVSRMSSPARASARATEDEAHRADDSARTWLAFADQILADAHRFKADHNLV